MSREQRLLMFVHQEISMWERITVWGELAVSESARQTHRRYSAVSTLLRASLADDETVVVQIGRPRLRLSQTRSVILLALLALIVAFEYGSYTIPSMREWFTTALHRCGL